MRIFFTVLFLSLFAEGWACTPIPTIGLPLFGPAAFGGAILGTIYVLLAVVIIKSLLYAYLAKHGWLSGFFDMFLGNIVSTIPGIVLGVAAASNTEIILYVCIPFAFVMNSICRTTFRRAGYEINGINVAVVPWVLLIGSIIMINMASNSPQTATMYWILKIGGLFCGLLSGIMVTFVIEGGFILWIHKFDTQEEAGRALKAVLSANLWSFFLVSLLGALYFLPHRMKRWDFMLYPDKAHGIFQ